MSAAVRFRGIIVGQIGISYVGVPKAARRAPAILFPNRNHPLKRLFAILLKFIVGGCHWHTML
jgi:hypothetical protein